MSKATASPRHYTYRVLKVLDWKKIDHVLLDMDGTLLDLRFDTEFWLQHLPDRYANVNELSFDEALECIRERMHALHGQLAWYCIDEWSNVLGVDVAELKREFADEIRYRDTSVTFLEALKATDKRALIVTNAHPATIEIKLEQTGLDTYVDRVVSSHDYGAAKEDQAFWRNLLNDQVFECDRTLLIDDSLPVLRAAKQFGIEHLLAVSHPDSGGDPLNTGEFGAIQWFTEIMPIE